MGLNIKNDRITALVRELAQRTGLTLTGAIEDAVRSRLAELDNQPHGGSRDFSTREARARKLLEELRRSISPTELSQLKSAEVDLYDDDGLPA
jgi:antitoxin VapB